MKQSQILNCVSTPQTTPPSRNLQGIDHVSKRLSDGPVSSTVTFKQIAFAGWSNDVGSGKPRAAIGTRLDKLCLAARAELRRISMFPIRRILLPTGCGNQPTFMPSLRCWNHGDLKMENGGIVA